MGVQHKDVTPPIADYLKHLEENRLNFENGIFPEGGWITHSSKHDGEFLVRVFNRSGVKLVPAATASDVNMILDRAVYVALSRPVTIRRISHHFYKEFFATVDARNVSSWTAAEVQLCALASKLDQAIQIYDVADKERLKSPSVEATRKFTSSSARVGKLIVQANAVFAKVEAERAVASDQK
jgi:hypothetical protein